MRLLKSPIAWFLLVPAGVVLWLIFGGVRSEDSKKSTSSGIQSFGATEESLAAVKVTVAAIERRTIQRSVEVYGTLHGFDEMMVSSKVEGRVKRVVHDVSDRVKPGELMLEIDETDAELAVQQAERALLVEMAKLGISEIPPEDYDVNKIPAVVHAKVQLENAKSKMDRSAGLLARRAISDEELEQRSTEQRMAEASYNIQVLQAKSGVATILMKDEALKTAKQQLRETKILVPVPTVNLPNGEEELSYSVAERRVSEGSYVRPGTELFRVVVDRVVETHAMVPERHAAEVEVGQETDVYTAAYEKPFRGKVTRINPTVDPKTRTFEVEIQVPNPEGKLKSGGFARVSIFTRTSEDVPTVPLESIVAFAGVTKVFLVEGDKVREVQVKLGEQTKEWVELMGAEVPKEGTVITSGQRMLADGSKIVIKEEGGTAPAVAGGAKSASQ